MTYIRALLLLLLSLMTVMRAAPLTRPPMSKEDGQGRSIRTIQNAAPFTITVVINSDSRGHILDTPVYFRGISIPAFCPHFSHCRAPFSR